MDNTRYVLAGDVGGTNLRIAAVDPAGSVVHHFRSSTPRSGSAADIAAAIGLGAEECIAKTGSSLPVAFGLALPALVNSSAGLVLSSPNLPQLNGLGLSKVIEDRLGFPVLLENDATAAAIGEHWLGSTRTAQNSVFVTLGTGVGGGLILNGQPYRGIDGTAGEIGHICVVPNGIDCGCGSRGCVEQYASGRAIARLATELMSARDSTREFLTSKEVFDAALGGDSNAVEAFRIMGAHLGIALGGLVNVLNPELIAIGGGVANGWEFFIEDVRTAISQHAFAPPAERASVVRATLGEAAGILGAARVAFDIA